MLLKRVRFKIVGISPLLQNNLAGMKPSNSDAVQVKPKDPKPVDQAKSLEYRTKDGQLWGPAVGIKQAILTAARNRKIDKKSAPAIVRGSVFEIEEKCLLYDVTTGKPIDIYEIDTRPVGIDTGKKAKVRVLRSRPKIDNWCTYIELEINEEFIHPHQVLELLNIAGPTVGWMDFRPEKGGKFGRFTAEAAENGAPASKKTKPA